MSELDCLLAACRDEPTEDSPRRILADWLEEHGDADRAEFIRLQIEQDAVQHPHLSPQAIPRGVRLARLLRRHRPAWLGPLRKFERMPSFNRGLINVYASVDELRRRPPAALPPGVRRWMEGLSVEQSEELERADEPDRFIDLMRTGALEPFTDLALISFNWTDEQLKRLAECPQLASLRDLTPLTLEAAEGLCHLVRSPHLTGLKRFGLCCNPLGAAGLEALARGPVLAGLTQLGLDDTHCAGGLKALTTTPDAAGLRRLNLSNNRLGHVGASLLATSPYLAGVEELDLWDGAIGAAGAKELAASPYLRPRRLNLGSNALSAAGARALAGSPLLERVQDLALPDCRLTPNALAALVHAPAATRLECLDLRFNTKLGDAGAEVLASSPYLGRLRVLQLDDSGIGPAGARALARSPFLNRLEVLDLSENPLGPRGLRELARGGGLPALRVLELEQVHAGVGGVRELAASELLGRLEVLDLIGNALSTGAMEALAGSRHVSSLRELYLSDNRIDDDALTVLMESRHLDGLIALDLGNNRVGDAGARALARSRLKTLATVHLPANRVTSAGADALLGWRRLRQLCELVLWDNPIDEERFERLHKAVYR